MIKHLPIQRHRDKDTWLQPLTYSVSRLEGGGASAMMACNNGHIGSLSEHEITIDGSVTPSVVCTGKECSFHEYVKLVGWTGT